MLWQSILYYYSHDCSKITNRSDYLPNYTTENLEAGIKILAKEFGFESTKDGFTVNVEKSCENRLIIQKNGTLATIKYHEKIHFFRGLGLLLEKLNEADNFKLLEYPQFTLNGAMFDVSQGNAVINVENVKKLLVKMSIMGLNMLMLYAEDSYEISDEPYFGYLRSKYTYNEMKELDDFAFSLGIEIIPCIQTLAHLIDVLKWSCYSEIRDDDDTLLVGHSASYQLIEKMIKAASAPFRSKRIHIGMDEAWKLGQGNYLKINGYKSKTDIMLEHLEKVMEIVNKCGLKAMMWSDMLFRAESLTNAYLEDGNELPKKLIERFPREIDLIFWDYYHDDRDFYDKGIKKHKEFGSTPIFAGGIWSWEGYGVNYGKTFVTTNHALVSYKDEGVKEVFTTIWGDDCTESNIYSTLLGLQLYAEHGYSKEVDIEKLKSRFKFCTGANFDDFWEIKYIEEIPGSSKDNLNGGNPSKCLMWQDILLGQFDKNIRGLDIAVHYEKLAIKMKEYAQRNGELNFVFEFLHKVSAVLSLKAEMGLRITDAYEGRNNSLLDRIKNNDLPELSVRVADLRKYHRKLWMQTNKPAGWEILDLRYGALLMRIDTTIGRISDFLDGKIENIAELDEEKLYFSGKPRMAYCTIYSRFVSASRISL